MPLRGAVLPLCDDKSYAGSKHRRTGHGALLRFLRQQWRALLVLLALGALLAGSAATARGAAGRISASARAAGVAGVAAPLTAATLCGPAPFFCRKRNAPVVAPRELVAPRDGGGGLRHSAAGGRVGGVLNDDADDPCAVRNWASLDVLLVVAHFSYNTSWLALQPFCFVLMEKLKPEAAPFNAAVNKGQEAWCYLQFIADHYARLPKRVVFLHDHRDSWHQMDMVPLLHALRLNAYPFASLNGIWNRGLNAFDYATLQRFWHEDVGGDDLGALPADINEGFRFMCCAQFIVARERLVARPRATYRRFLAALRDTSLTNARSSRCMEWSWHVIFGQPWRDTEPDEVRLCGEAGGACFHRLSKMRYPNSPDDAQKDEQQWTRRERARGQVGGGDAHAHR